MELSIIQLTNQDFVIQNGPDVEIQVYSFVE